MLDATELKFEPEFSSIQKLVLNVFTLVADVMKSFPSLDGMVAKATIGKTSLDETKRLPVVGAVILPEQMGLMLCEMEKLLDEEFQKPKQFMLKFASFDEIIGGKCTKRMSTFVAAEHSYEEFLVEMEYFLKVSSDVYASAAKTTYLGLFSVNCEELFTGLTKRIERVLDG